MMPEKYLFSQPLIEGIIRSRPNRFIMLVEIEGVVIKCHCPSTGRIGSLKFEDIPCLLSKSTDPSRKTPCTVEAISLDPPEQINRSWIGIDQVRANDYVYFFLKKELLKEMTGPVNDIRREVKLGNSRIDFLVNGRDYVEVKTMLMDIPCEGHPKYRKSMSKFSSFDRLIKHFGDVSGSIAGGSKAVLLMCYLYDAKRFEVPQASAREMRIVKAAERATRKGLENWQVNLQVDRYGVSLLDYFKLDLFNVA